MKAFALVGITRYHKLKSILEICFYRSRTVTFRFIRSAPTIFEAIHRDWLLCLRYFIV